MNVTTPGPCDNSALPRRPGFAIRGHVFCSIQPAAQGVFKASYCGVQISVLQAGAGSSDLAWAAAFSPGGPVAGTVHEVRDFGVILDLPNDVVGFVTHYQGEPRSIFSWNRRI